MSSTVPSVGSNATACATSVAWWFSHVIPRHITPRRATSRHVAKNERRLSGTAVRGVRDRLGSGENWGETPRVGIPSGNNMPYRDGGNEQDGKS